MAFGSFFGGGPQQQRIQNPPQQQQQTGNPPEEKVEDTAEETNPFDDIFGEPDETQDETAPAGSTLVYGADGVVLGSMSADNVFTPKGQKPAAGPNQNESLATEIQNMIAAMNLKEDLVPEDFNPADPKQLRDLLNKSNQQTAMAVVQMTMKPMTVAFQQFSSDIKTFIGDSLKNNNQGTQAQQLFEREIPESKGEHGAMAKNMFENAMKRTKGDAKAAVAATRRALDALGIKNKPQGDPMAGGSGFKQGTAALDSMFSDLANNLNTNRK